jgi:enoyl-[acyl-carrier protein] reductase I
VGFGPRGTSVPPKLECLFMPQLLEGKNAIVLGVANKWSIAYSIAAAFVRERATLILTYQSERQKETVEELGRELGAKSVIACDVTREEELSTLVSRLQNEIGTLDVCVHSIAFANREDLNRPFLETGRDGYLLAQEVSSYSLIAVARAIVPLMTNGGSIQALTYLGSTRVIPNYNVMGVAKAALESAMRYLAGELGEKNIRVNAISAGPIKTASARAVKDLTKMLDNFSENAPLRRNTDPAEVADTSVFLASDLARGVTGNIIFVDAGYQIMGMKHSG